MDRAHISAIAHAEHPVMAPLSDDAVAGVLGALPVPHGGHVGDFGCGQGVWLVRLLQQRGDLRGTGIDTSDVALVAARERADAAGVSDRVQWLRGDVATDLGDPMEGALCVGSTHAFGGLAGTLDAIRERVIPGAGLVLGEGFWEPSPTARALEVIGDLPDLAGLVSTCQERGWEVVHGHVSSAEEWDAYEWSWAGSLTRWGLEHMEPPDGAAALEALATARKHLDEWLNGYRGQLGFATLVLGDANG